MHPILTSNLNFLWGGLVAETLRRCGLTHAIISPGSRSAPLATAFALTPGLESIIAQDERSAAFYALGLAKSTGQPVALICTSGTAVANYLPAVIEAHLSHTPLLILSADRPPELRDCSSGQTIDQHKIFGNHVLNYHETALPHEDRLGYIRNTLRQAWQRATGPHPGPVHLNIPFRDPLAPEPDGRKHAIPADFFPGQFCAPEVPTTFCPDLRPLLKHPRGLIIVGPAHPTDCEAWLRGLAELARCLGWPVLTDPLNPLRHHDLPGVTRIAHYDLILRDPQSAKALKPDATLQIGPLPTSKTLRQWLSTLSCPSWILDPGPENRDPLHRNTSAWIGTIETLGRLGAYHDEDSPYASQWASHNHRAHEYLQDTFAGITTLFEGKLPHCIAGSLHPETPVFIASSMPVRDAEYFWPATDRHYRIYANREANGIDGTLSTALGVMHGCGKPGLLITGDLAFLHDQNGLLFAPDYPGSLTILIINNHGGGIFENLPIARFDPPFEACFATPQHVRFAHIAQAHQIPYHAPATWDELTALLRQLPGRGLRIIALETDRKADAALRKDIFQGLNA